MTENSPRFSDFVDDFTKYKEAKERLQEAKTEFEQDKLSEAELNRMTQWHDDAWARVVESHRRCSR